MRQQIGTMDQGGGNRGQQQQKTAILKWHHTKNENKQWHISASLSMATIWYIYVVAASVVLT